MTSAPAGWASRHGRVVLFGTAVAMTGLAWLHRFVQDDAFISFRYARHLAEGHGLVWNVGERPIEGFTNLLWTLLVALAMKCGREPVATSMVLGLGSFVVTMLATQAIVTLLTGSRFAAWVATVLLGTNYTFSAYATGGLETQLQAALFTVAAWLTLRVIVRKERRHLAALSVVLALAIATRLDSALVVVVLGIAATLAIVRDLEDGRSRSLALLILPGGAGVVALVAWKLSYFGAVLPNTFYVKAASPALGFRGVEYVVAFLRHYGLLLASAIASVFAVRAAKASGRRALVLLAAVALWTLYVAAVGGDFMEFRFMVPVLPLFVAFLVWSWVAGGAGRALTLAMTGALIFDSFAHEYDTSDEAFLMDGAGIETIPALQAHLKDPNQDWATLGKALGASFDERDQVSIAVMAAGAIPYYSDLRTIDMLGLNDAWIARHGVANSSRPGHARVAPAEYLVLERVSFVVHPWVPDAPPQRAAAYDVEDLHDWLKFSSPEAIPQGAEIVEIPITKERTLRVLYLVRQAAVDRHIAEHGWRVFPITRRAPPAP